MAYLVQTKFKNSFKDFHLNECVYVNDFKTLEPEEEGALLVSVFDELDIKRVEMRKKVKRGEVNIDDLSLPVFASSDEKEMAVTKNE